MQLPFIVAVLVVGAASRSPVKTSISSLKCEEYSSYVEGGECQARPQDSQIVGKIPTRPREFPHMAHIGFVGDDDDNEIAYQCGGTLIAPNAVLTAAHCVKNGKAPGFVLLGELDHSTSSDDARPERIAVKERVAHPDFKAPSVYNDIAVLRLERSANLSSYVRPACLHTGPDLEAGERLVATGWGVTEFAGDASDKLMKVSLPIASHSECAESFSEPIRRLPDGIRDRSQICAGGAAGQGETCHGDDGGPLQILVDEPRCMYAVVGITSFGKACHSGSPGVYTRVKHFVPWIEKTVWP